MSTTGRRSGTSPRRAKQSTIDRAPALEPEPAVAPEPAATPASDALLLDDHATPITGHGPRLGRSLTGAIVGSLLVVGLAFGAAIGPGGALGPNGDAANDTSVAGHGGHGEYGDGGDGYGDGKDDSWVDPEVTAKPGDGEGSEPTDKPEEPDPTEKPSVPDPTKQPEPDPTKKPEPKATPKPTEKPDPTKDPTEPIWLELAIVEFHPKLAWGSCDGLDFDYYKVVRSSDSTVSWPPSDGDEMIGAVEQGGYRKAYDKDAPHGDKAWYRVFCVRKTEAGYKVVTASPTKGIEVPAEPAPPDPIGLELSAEVNDAGKVVLDWSVCEVDGFAFYKVVKSTWNDNPSYLPWTDGSEVIAVVEGMYATEWLDWAPDAGGTAWYRVQCIGYSDDGKVLLGQTATVSVTTPE